MTRPVRKRLKSYHFPRSALGLAILMAAGLAGNYFSLPLFFGVDFLFGSILTLIAVLPKLYLYKRSTLRVKLVSQLNKLPIEELNNLSCLHCGL